MVQNDAPETPPEVGVPFKGGPVEPPAEEVDVAEVVEEVEDPGYDGDDEGEDEEEEDTS